MKKLITPTISFSLLLALASCKKDLIIPAQLLANTDFEAGINQPNTWVAGGTSSSASFEWTKEESASATHSVKIVQATGGTGSCYWMQAYEGAMPVGGDLILSAKIKAKNVTGLGVTIDIRVDNTVPAKALGSQYANSSGKTSILGDFDWTTYNIKLVNLNKDAKVITIFLSFLPNSAGTVYFDDVTLTHN